MRSPTLSDALRRQLAERLGRAVTPAWDAALDLGDWLEESGTRAVSARALERLFGRSRSVMHALDAIQRRITAPVLRDAGVLPPGGDDRREATAVRALSREQLYRVAQAAPDARAAALRRELDRAARPRRGLSPPGREPATHPDAGFQLHIRRPLAELDAPSAAAYAARVAGVIVTLARLGAPAMSPEAARAAGEALAEAARLLRERSRDTRDLPRTESG